MALLFIHGAMAAGPGVVVEKVERGGAAEAAGLAVGDVLMSWRGLPSARSRPSGRERESPAVSRPGHGDFVSAFDLMVVETQQAPLGRVSLQGRRPDGGFSLVMPPGEWRLRARPRFEGSTLESYLQAVGHAEGGETGTAVEEVRNLVDDSTGEVADRVWLLLRAAEWLGKEGSWEPAAKLLDEAAKLARADDRLDLERKLRQSEGALLEENSLYQEATRAYGEALALQQRLSPGGLGEAAILFKLGRVMYKREDLATSEEYLQRSLGILDRLASASMAMARTLNRLGNVAAGGGERSAADAYYQRSLEICQRLAPGGLEVAENLNDLGSVAFEYDDLSAAEAQFQAALEIQERLVPGGSEFASTVSNLAGVAWRRGNLHESAELLQRALEIHERIAPGGSNVAWTLNNLGVLMRKIGDLARAEEYYKRSLKSVERLSPGGLSVASSLNNLGNVARERGDLALADDFLRRSLKIKQQQAPDTLSTAGTLSNIGSVAFQRGDLRIAYDYFQQALVLKQRLAPDGLAVADILSNLGVFASGENDLASAEDFHQRSLEIKQRNAPGSLAVSDSLNSLGRVALSRGDLDLAGDYLRQALSIRERLAPHSLAVAGSLAGLGDHATKTGEPQAAEGFHRRALEIHVRLAPGSGREAESAAALARLTRGTRPKEAIALFDQAVLALEKQQGRLGGVEDVRTAFRSRYVDIYRDLIDLLVLQNQDSEAFHVLERSRARSLSALLAERDLIFSADIPHELDRQRRVLSAKFDRAQEELAKLSVRGDPGPIEALRDKLLALRRQQAEVTEEIRKKSPDLAALQYPEPLDLAGARSILDSGTALLSYSVAQDRTQVFTIDAEGRLTVDTLPLGEAELGVEVRRFRDAIAHSRRETSLEELLGRGQRLYELLIAPMAARLESADRVQIVPDGPLHLLPFAALVRPGGTEGKNPGQYLVEWKPTHVVASVTVYKQLRKARARKKTPGTLKVLAFGDPSYPQLVASPGSPPGDPIVHSLLAQAGAFNLLRASRDEVRYITDIFGDAATALLGAEATEERAKSAGMDVDLIHFAAHGVIDERFPLNSAIVLSIPETIEYGQDNGVLQAWEIFESLRIDASLVTLSACETALGRKLAGEGIIGLTRAFQYAGARSVLASLWNVSDRSTAELMKNFYSYLKEGRSKDEALRAAQIGLILGDVAARGQDQVRGVKTLAKGDSDTARSYGAPFYWAAFQLFGDWH